jgi:hypothetical protein
MFIIQKIILNNDTKQYDSYVETIIKQHNRVVNFESKLNDIMISFKKDYVKIVENTLCPKQIINKHSYYVINDNMNNNI